MTRVLIVDDDAELIELLRDYLAEEGFETASAADGESGARAAVEGAPDLVVLDVMLPRLNGFDALRRIRESSAVPVVMLTARGQEVDRIVGLELGADDYLPKPFNPRELVARIRAVLRRGRQGGGGSVAVVVGDLRLDPGARRVQRGGETVEVTGTEYSLLEALVRDAGKVVKREALYREVLGRRPVPYDRSLDVHVSNLRRKLGPLPDGGERIKSVRGVGYQYVRVEA
jgi:two-component system response regulator CpxR